MIISATGIVVDHYGDVLLIQRNDTRTLAPPGGAADIGELPPETAVREVREETGLIVMAVRLVGLYYLPFQPRPFLTLVFRCIMRGGEIQTSEESPQAGFFKTNPLPKTMLAMHAQRVQRSIRHEGGPPYWGTNPLSTRMRLGNLLLNHLIYPWLHFRRRRAGLPVYEPPPSWQTQAYTILRNEKGDVLWLKDQESHVWRLPGGAAAHEEPPWTTAERSVAGSGLRIELNGLTGVYPAADKPQMVFCFSGSLAGPVDGLASTETAFFAPGHEPELALNDHATFVLDAVQDSSEVTFRHLGSPVTGTGKGSM